MKFLSKTAALGLSLFTVAAFTSATPIPVYAQEQTDLAIIEQVGDIAIAVQQELDARIESASSEALRQRLIEVRAFYEIRDFESIWIEDGKPSIYAREFVDALLRAKEDGLDPDDYDADELFQKLHVGNVTTIADLEIHLSTSLVSFAQHLNAGRLDPERVTQENVIYPAAISAERVLDQISSTGNIKVYLRLLAPHTPRYERLRAALATYRRIAANGGWPEFPGGDVLRPGANDERVPILRKRLALSEDFKGATSNSSTNYDAPLVEAVKKFQSRHGLEVDGVVGADVSEQINISVEQRIETIEYNLERRRWMQNDYGPRYIFTNLTDRVLKYVDNEKTRHAELIQAGQSFRGTPIFSDEMEYIEFNPYWTVPHKIATRKMLPRLQQNAGALSSQGYEIIKDGKVVDASSIRWSNYSLNDFPFRIRQKPGGDNALGQVRFMFPNQFNVSIHDTPDSAKFDETSRFAGFGYLRLRDPLKMAELILKDQGWDREKIDEVVKSGQRAVVQLDDTVRVHIAYLTAWVNKDGSVQFRRDEYGRDEILANALLKVRGR